MSSKAVAAAKTRGDEVSWLRQALEDRVEELMAQRKLSRTQAITELRWLPK